MVFNALNHQWICKHWKCCNVVYGALTFISKIYSGRIVLWEGWRYMSVCISSNFILVTCFVLQTNRKGRLCIRKFRYEYVDNSARGTACFTNSKLSLFSTFFNFHSASFSFLFKCPLFSIYWELYFSFSHNILKDDSAAQFSREQKHTVEAFFFLHGCISYHYNP